jgi:hypothetical protein
MFRQPIDRILRRNHLFFFQTENEIVGRGP